jgi:hypothetical protein
MRAPVYLLDAPLFSFLFFPSFHFGSFFQSSFLTNPFTAPIQHHHLHQNASHATYVVSHTLHAEYEWAKLSYDILCTSWHLLHEPLCLCIVSFSASYFALFLPPPCSRRILKFVFLFIVCVRFPHVSLVDSGPSTFVLPWLACCPCTASTHAFRLRRDAHDQRLWTLTPIKVTSTSCDLSKKFISSTLSFLLWHPYLRP